MPLHPSIARIARPAAATALLSAGGAAFANRAVGFAEKSCPEKPSDVREATALGAVMAPVTYELVHPVVQSLAKRGGAVALRMVPRAAGRALPYYLAGMGAAGFGAGIGLEHSVDIGKARDRGAAVGAFLGPVTYRALRAAVGPRVSALGAVALAVGGTVYAYHEVNGDDFLSWD